MTSADLLSTAKLAGAEDAYTELVAWALSPNTHLPSATERQKAWLQRAPFVGEIDFCHTAEPRTQFATRDGFPDVVLQYKNCVVVVEAKTGSQEHKAPGGQFQTIAYPPAVAEALRLAPATPIHTVFLTVAGEAARNPLAFSTTFAEFSIRTMEALECCEGVGLAADIRFAFSMLFTHFLTEGSRGGAGIRPAIELFCRWENRLSDLRFLEEHLNDITVSVDALPWEVRNESVLTVQRCR